MRAVFHLVLLSVLLGGSLVVMAQPEAASTDASPIGAAAAAGPEADAGPELEEQGQVRSLFAKLWAGGPIVAVQILLSVVALAVCVERAVNLRRRHVIPGGLVEACDAAWREGQHDEIQRRCRAAPSVLSASLLAMAEHRGEARSEAIAAAGAVGRPLLRKELQRAYPIAVIAMLQPLLGLLGTVWGLIGAFDAIALAGAMGDPSIFADQIALALITTAVGLALAIPLLALYHYFKSRTLSMSIDAEVLLTGVAERWFPKRAPDTAAATTRSSPPEPRSQPVPARAAPVKEAPNV